MDEIISRQAAIKAIDDLPNCYNGYSDTYDKSYIIGVLEEVPSVEPKKVVEDYCRPRNLMVVSAENFRLFTEPKPGKWEHHIGIGNVALLKCGECGFTYPELLGMMLFKFCPNCGAKMERSEE